MKQERLNELLDRFSSRRIAVLGDFFLDKYLEADPALAETSVETGKIAHQVAAIRAYPGAAGTVVNNLEALGAKTLHAVGAVGDDGEGYDLRRGLHARGCSTDRLLAFDSLHTPTYLKPRNIAVPGLEGEFERYDTKNRGRTPQAIIDKVISALDGLLPEVDAVIIADQVEQDDCGVVTASMRSAIAERAKKYPKVIFWADSRTHIRLFRNVIIKPNQFEAVGHENPVPGEEVSLSRLREALPKLRAETGAPVCVTRGEHGMIVSDPEVTVVPGVKLTGPTDPTGAGDSATAGALLAFASGATLPEAALVGCLVASITVQQLATTGTATPAQVRERLEMWRSQNT
ncbi:MAG: bifunctional heptose 7-phosphate kinase/heptose 1-phosphate adenyltransferase [Planctomycetaceae bacterium]